MQDQQESTQRILRDRNTIKKNTSRDFTNLPDEDSASLQKRNLKSHKMQTATNKINKNKKYQKQEEKTSKKLDNIENSIDASEQKCKTDFQSIQSNQLINCMSDPTEQEQYVAKIEFTGNHTSPLALSGVKRHIQRLDFNCCDSSESSIQHTPKKVKTNSGVKAMVFFKTRECKTNEGDIPTTKKEQYIQVYKVDDKSLANQQTQMKFDQQKYNNKFSSNNQVKKTRQITLNSINSIAISGDQLYDLLDKNSVLCKTADGRQLQSISDFNNQLHSLEKKKISCNCKKTKCLKLYCDCFANSEMCSPDCKCSNCMNKPENKKEREQAIINLNMRNPQAFEPKIKKIEDVKEQELMIHHKGCNCKKSNCLKKYCECYNSGVKCSTQCKCENCNNCEDNCNQQNLQMEQHQIFPQHGNQQIRSIQMNMPQLFIGQSTQRIYHPFHQIPIQQSTEQEINQLFQQ